MASAALLSSCHRLTVDSVYIVAQRSLAIDRPVDGTAVADTVWRPGPSLVPPFDDRGDHPPAAQRDGLAIAVSFVLHLIAVASMTLAWPVAQIRRSSANGAMTVTLVTATIAEKPSIIPRRFSPAMTSQATNPQRLPAPGPAGATKLQAPAVALLTPSHPPGANIATITPPDAARPPAAEGGVPAADKPATTHVTVVAGKSAEEASWERSVMSRLALRKRYPSAARNAGLSDEVMLRLIIDREGHLLAAELARSRGIALLDKAALDMAARSSPYPAPPSSVAGDAIRLLVPVQFLITARR